MLAILQSDSPGKCNSPFCIQLCGHFRFPGLHNKDKAWLLHLSMLQIVHRLGEISRASETETIPLPPHALGYQRLSCGRKDQIHVPQ